MRLFIAIPLPDEIKKYITTIQQKFSDLKLAPYEQLHLTLKFFEDVNPDDLMNLLEQINEQRFLLHLTSLGVFPSRTQPRVLWIGTSNEVLSLQRQIENITSRYPSDKKFHSHITLGRINNIDKEKFLKELTMKIEPLSFEVKKFCLYQSTLRTTGAEHTLLKTYSLV